MSADEHPARESEVRRVLGKLQVHGYPLHAPLPEDAVAAFEAQHAIRLPEDYRAFLTIAGDGGTGPYYGVTRLADWGEWFEEQVTNPAFLSTPCPMVYKQVVSPTWKESLPGDWEQWGCGSLHLCSLGCTYSARLIVNGASRGRVVYLDANNGDSRPYFVRDLNFVAWYERWLDLFIADAPMFWFGMDNPDYPHRSVDPAVDAQILARAEKLAGKRYVPKIYSRAPEELPKRA